PVSRAGVRAGAAQRAGPDHQHDRHSRATTTQVTHRLLGREGRVGDAHEIARARARSGRPRQWHRAGARALPERGLDPALRAEIIAKTALKRSGSPDDVARTALYLACEAPFVTGQIIAV